MALEGIDGSGKTTALQEVAEVLRTAGFTVSEVRYTARTGLAGRLIAWLYHPRPPSRIVARLRRYRVLQVIVYGANGRANLRRRTRGTRILLSDRSLLSGHAHAGRVPRWLVTLASPRCAPDLVIFLDLDPADASRRLQDRGGADYAEDLASLYAFRDAYEHVMASPPRLLRRARFRVIDASSDRDSTVEFIRAAIFDVMRGFRY